MLLRTFLARGFAKTLAMGYIVLFALCFGFAICIAAFADVTLQNGTLPDFASLCPYSTMCSSVATKSIKDSDMTTCCQKCSCANDCHMVGNCCPDIQASHLIGPFYPCVEARKIFNEERGLKFVPNYNLWIRVIDTCPDHHSENAFSACERPIKLQDFVMVSDSDGAKVFKNQHCARCHGVDKYVVWDIHVDCSEIMSKSFETFIDRDQYILNNCALMSLPADITLLEKSRCYPDYAIINKCGSTNRRVTYETELEHACETTIATQNTLFFEYLETRLIQIYANVYCYYCNKPKGFLGDDTCPVDAIIIQKANRFVAFTSILNIEVAEHQDQKTRCGYMSIWDQFEGICRSLFCPAGSMAVNGVCIEGSMLVLGHSMTLLFEVHGFDQQSHTLLKFLATELFQYHEQHFRCGKCTPIMFSSKDSSEIFLEISIYTTKVCSQKYALEFLGNLANQSPIEMQFTETNIFFNISLRTTFEQPKYQINHIALAGGDICPNVTPIINPVTLQNCPRIELSAQEVKDLHVNHVQPENEFENKLITNTQTNNTSVCLDAYLQMRNLGRSRSGGKELQFSKAGMIMYILLLFWVNVC